MIYYNETGRYYEWYCPICDEQFCRYKWEITLVEFEDFVNEHLCEHDV